jgi:hypothetical protein
MDMPFVQSSASNAQYALACAAVIDVLAIGHGASRFSLGSAAIAWIAGAIVWAVINGRIARGLRIGAIADTVVAMLMIFGFSWDLATGASSGSTRAAIAAGPALLTTAEANPLHATGEAATAAWGVTLFFASGCLLSSPRFFVT